MNTPPPAAAAASGAPPLRPTVLRIAPGGASGSSRRRIPVTHRDDVHAQHGRLLAALHAAGSPVERLLAAARIGVVFVTNLLAPSAAADDLPLLTLGHHMLSHRVLQQGQEQEQEQAAAAGSGAAGAATTSKTGGAATSATEQQQQTQPLEQRRAYVQEIASFDAAEGPKGFVGLEGAPLAAASLRVEPVAVARARRLLPSGREQLGVRLELRPAAVSNDDGGGGGIGSSGVGRVALLQRGEEYVIEALPSLVFSGDPTAPGAPALTPVALKGQLRVAAPATGLLLALTFARDGGARGTIETLQAGGGGAAGKLAAAAAAAAFKGSGGGGGVVVGTLDGSWLSRITASCPKLAFEGVLYEAPPPPPPPPPAAAAAPAAGGGAAAAPPPPPPLPPLLGAVNLRRLGPMRLPHAWAALHEALQWASPRDAVGGKAASKLALALGRHLRALTPEAAASRDDVITAAAPATSSAAAAGARAASVAARSTTAASSVGGGADSDVEEFDRALEAAARGGGGSKQQGAPTAAAAAGGDDDVERDAPPCVRAEHAAGRRLRYQLHYTLTAAPLVVVAGGGGGGGSAVAG